MECRQHSHQGASTSQQHQTCRRTSTHPRCLPRNTPRISPIRLPGTQRLAPCRVTHTSDEYDYLREKPKSTIMIDQTPIPNPELGPLERRVSLTYLDALQDDTFRQADIDYWFNEPEGGWNRPPLELQPLEEIEPLEPITGAHPGEGRTPLEQISEGDVIEGTVRATMYLYGITIDFGAEYDGLIPIVERQWTDEINELISVGATVKARVYAIRDPEWFRFPVQLEILEPAIGHMIEQPEKHIAALDLRGKPQDFELYLEKSGRNYVRRKYWADFEQDDMDYLRQYDEEYTDEKLLIEETNWLEGSETLQSMVEEGFEELMDAEDLDFESAF